VQFQVGNELFELSIILTGGCGCAKPGWAFGSTGELDEHYLSS
jgi:hypothetical protein